MYKFQEDIRRDREMRDKRSKEEEFLRSSLRGSEKMKRLEHRPAPTGFVNNGCDAHAHDGDHVPTPGGLGKWHCTAPVCGPSQSPTDRSHVEGRWQALPAGQMCRAAAPPLPPANTVVKMALNIIMRG